MTLGQAHAVREMENAGFSVEHQAEWDSLVAAADALIAFTATARAKAAAESDSLRTVVVEDEGDDEEWIIGPRSQFGPRLSNFKETP